MNTIHEGDVDMIARDFQKIVVVLVFTALMLFTSCFLLPSGGFYNALTLRGTIHSASDSTIVTGIQVTVYHLGNSRVECTVTSDKLGEFYCHWSKLTDDNTGDYREWLISVRDIDGDINGLYADLDTIVVEDDPDDNSTTEWYLDLYLDLE